MRSLLLALLVGQAAAPPPPGGSSLLETSSGWLERGRELLQAAHPLDARDAFDQAVGLYIYRENMRDRVLPLPLQSVVLFLTFMFGPIGYLAYFVARYVRRGNAPGGSMDITAPAPRSPSAQPAPTAA